MRAKILAAGISGIAITVAGYLPAMAHHYRAEWDDDHQMTLEATVKEWQWTNPHSWLIVVAPDGKGGTVEWSLEGRSPSGYRSAGVYRNTVKPGDKVVLIVSPSKTGEAKGGFNGIITINGQPGPGRFDIPPNEKVPGGGKPPQQNQ